MIQHSRTYIAIPPGVTIKEMIDDREITVEQLAARLEESDTFVRDLIDGEVELTEQMAGKLETSLGMNTRFWLNLEHYYREDLINIDKENAQEAARKAKKTIRKAKTGKKKADVSIQAGLAASG